MTDSRLFLAALFSITFSWKAQAGLPIQFDLRSKSGENFVTSVKKQNGGTCWTHSTMAAIESNLLITRAWKRAGENGEPNLAEYHLDWWNGFNQNLNADIKPEVAGLEVHEGGDYRVAAAYLARGDGAVRDSDAQSFTKAPAQNSSLYHHYYVRDIEWLSAGADLSHIDDIKNALVDHGAVGTALAWSNSFYSKRLNSFYQPSSSTLAPNHAVTIVGWDDRRKTQSEKPGAWLIKNSWGTAWGNGGYFWISYYDKTATKHREMGAVSFQNVEPMRYNRVYSHDYHGWRDTKVSVSEAFNVFVGLGNPQGGPEILRAVSFYTATENVKYTVKIFDRFESGSLSGELASKEEVIAHSGMHTVDLDSILTVRPGDKFYVYLKLSGGGHPFDRTSDVPVLLGGSSRTLVESRATQGESFYFNGSSWVDLTHDDASANFCIKALTTF